MRELSLFTGAGGGLLGTLLLGFTPIGYVEYDDFCQRVIAQRIADGILPAAPIFGDVREFLESGAAREYRGFADVVTAGWPCQPHSNAGRRKGAADAREGWPWVIETIRQARPQWFLGENVPGILSTDAGRYFAGIQRDLAESGYDCRWRVLSAAELGAPHKRDRLWIVAYDTRQRAWELSIRQGRQDEAATDLNGVGKAISYTTNERTKWGAGGKAAASGHARCWGIEPEGSNSDGREDHVAHTDGRCGERTQQQVCPGRFLTESGGESLAHADGKGCLQPRANRGIPELAGVESCGDGRQWWTTEPELGRLAHGVPHRVDRLRAAGNGQVPAVVAAAWRLLTAELLAEPDFGELEAYWPDLADVPDGVDRFAQYPIAGEPIGDEQHGGEQQD